MKVYVGADHRGYNIKTKVIAILKKNGHEVVDCGSYDAKIKSDYPITAYKVASNVAKSKNDRGILVCMSGLGQMIAANKVRGAYAALCHNSATAILSRRHNNANVLVLSAKFIRAKELEKIVKIWLKTKFDGGRHLRRFKQIQEIERRFK